MSEHPFYGQKIPRLQQQELVQHALDQFKGETVNEELQEKVYNHLSQLKFEGALTMPFKVVLQTDESGFREPYIEVLLETKV